MDSDIFSKFQHPQEASLVGFENVLKTEKARHLISMLRLKDHSTFSPGWLYVRLE